MFQPFLSSVSSTDHGSGSLRSRPSMFASVDLKGDGLTGLCCPTPAVVDCTVEAIASAERPLWANVFILGVHCRLRQIVRVPSAFRREQVRPSGEEAVQVLRERAFGLDVPVHYFVLLREHEHLTVREHFAQPHDGAEVFIVEQVSGDVEPEVLSVPHCLADHPEEHWLSEPSDGCVPSVSPSDDWPEQSEFLCIALVSAGAIASSGARHDRKERHARNLAHFCVPL